MDASSLVLDRPMTLARTAISASTRRAACSTGCITSHDPRPFMGGVDAQKSAGPVLRTWAVGLAQATVPASSSPAAQATVALPAPSPGDRSNLRTYDEACVSSDASKGGTVAALRAAAVRNREPARGVRARAPSH